MKYGLGIVGFIAMVTTGAWAQETTSTLEGSRGISEDRYWNDSKGYPKRPRLAGHSEWYVSPTQLHEVSGAYTEAGYLYSDKLSLNQDNVDIDNRLRANTAQVRGYYSAGYGTLGVDGEYTTLQNEASLSDVSDTKAEIYMARPQYAIGLSSYFTLAAGAELVNETRQLENRRAFGSTDAEATHDYISGIYAMAFHNETSEVGLMYKSEVADNETFENVNENIESNIYRPAEYTLYARANMSDHWSLLGYASFSDYDRANDIDTDELFDKYKPEDRTAGLLQIAYWTSRRSRLGVGARYQGAATRGTLAQTSNYVGESVANMIGLQAEFLLQMNDDLGFNFVGKYLMGQRDETVETVRYAQETRAFTVGTGVNYRL